MSFRRGRDNRLHGSGRNASPSVAVGFHDARLRDAGAVKTIIQMLGSEQKRAAAVTMLGKTVEQSADQVGPSALSCRSKISSCYTTCTRYNKLLSSHSGQS